MTLPIERRSAARDAERWHWPAAMHGVLRQVLARRALGSPEELSLELGEIVPVGRFDALAPAVELLVAHRDRHVVVVGDFDADGATSTALVVATLRDLGFARVSFFVPDRFELGYGLSPEVVARVLPLEPTLIVTVDNGISSVAGVGAARDAGLDVLITDHHLAPAALPRANAIVNPNLPGDAFPGKQLAGVGVAFYLLAALGRALGSPNAASAYLDLVALGTVADLVRLDRLNRILVAQGLRRIRAGRCRPGIRALCEVAGVERGALTAAALGFQLAPRLNAAGRLDDMSIGVRCLLASSDAEAAQLAATLDELNRSRRELETRMRAEAIELVDALGPLDAADAPGLICLRRDGWHEGLVGLIASRLKDRYRRPAFVFATGESGALKGSGRSVAGFHLRDALADVDALHPGLIERYGGHAMAAGLTIAPEAFEPFERAIGEVARARLDAEQLSERILTDGELAAADMNLEVARLLREAGPWGQGFPEPCFDGRFELVDFRVLKGAHLKLALRPIGAATGGAGAAPLDAIAFNRAECEWPVGTELVVVYRLDVNDFPSTPRVQLVVTHVAAADTARSSG